MYMCVYRSHLTATGSVLSRGGMGGRGGRSMAAYLVLGLEPGRDEAVAAVGLGRWSGRGYRLRRYWDSPGHWRSVVAGS